MNRISIQQTSLVVAVIAIIALGGCSKPASNVDDPKLEAPPQRKLHLTGSSTMTPLIKEIAKHFQQTHPDVEITVETGGSSRGVKDAREGTADIGMASRALIDSEKDLSGLAIARDGICLLVNKENPVQSLTNAQVAALYTGSITNWKSVGGLDEPITVVNRAEGRSEVELFLGYFKIKKEDVKAQATAGDNLLGIQAVISDRKAIVYLSVGESQRMVDKGTPVRLLPTNGIAATIHNIRTGDYPLSRPLTLVTKGIPTGLAEEFITYCLSPEVVDIIHAQGFVSFQD